ncbi:hypothetical protein EDD16DRAFT_1747770 [Pisolithus croceorrhizus]|nr:hypothetical protein EDD16DRAFT_1721473 [Pisolithus croceorrhizus]KAI6105253.1 hypothetical protein EDD16DRAFT_1747770 [Pisolithus croceorrhizus]
MLTILHELAKRRNDQTGEFALDTFKVVYVAPTKVLIQEMVSSFSSRLLPFSIKVGELTGDSDDEATNCQDANYSHDAREVGRHYSSTDMSCTNLVRLMIVDEIHLLHDERGPLSNYDKGMLRTSLSSRIGISSDSDFEPPEDVEQHDVSVFTIQIRLYNSPPSRYSSLSDGQRRAQDTPLVRNWYLE